mmetsp:Transcript_20217/g.51174  ORF Transcript_20217/g.51174 Transcript_20217/m.51174 type:complete len:212 (-) Transcript_20217:255-890(-)
MVRCATGGHMWSRVYRDRERSGERRCFVGGGLLGWGRTRAEGVGLPPLLLLRLLKLKHREVWRRPVDAPERHAVHVPLHLRHIRKRLADDLEGIGGCSVEALARPVGERGGCVAVEPPVVAWRIVVLSSRRRVHEDQALELGHTRHLTHCQPKHWVVLEGRGGDHQIVRAVGDRELLAGHHDDVDARMGLDVEGGVVGAPPQEDSPRRGER